MCNQMEITCKKIHFQTPLGSWLREHKLKVPLNKEKSKQNKNRAVDFAAQQFFKVFHFLQSFQNVFE